VRLRYGVPRYGFWQFVLDVCLVLLTGGLWLIWIFVREMRLRNINR
jgi:hypothetical protein